MFKWLKSRKQTSQPTPSIEDLESLGYEIQTVSLEGDPEEAAEQLLEPHLWRVPLDQIDLSIQQGQAQFLARFIASEDKASLEKDELIRFTERNRESLPFFMDDLLPKMLEAMKGTPDAERLSHVIDYFLENLRHAYAKEYDKINLRSDRLFWLIYVLASQLNDRKLTYDQAIAYLRKPQHRQRISPSQLQYMLFDYARSINQPNQPPIEMLLLIGEAALLSDDTKSAHASFSVVLTIGTTDNPDHLLQFIDHLQPYLAKKNLLDAKDLSALKRVQARYATGITPDDF